MVRYTKKGVLYLKKYIFILTVLLLSLSGCGDESLIQEDFKKDIDQVLGSLNKAYEENRELNDEEEIVIDKFSDKYLVGKFLLSDGTEYEMNDLEKSIANDIDDLKNFTKSEEKLASEEDLYTSIKKDINENLEAKEIPEALKGQYPTYEMYQGVHPQIVEAGNEIINAFDKIVNGDSNEYNSTNMYLLNSFVKNYGERTFEIDDKSYLLNDESWNILYTFMELKKDIENGKISSYTIDLFNETKETLKK